MALGRVGRRHYKCWLGMDRGAFSNTQCPETKKSTSTNFISTEKQCMTIQEVHLCAPKPKCTQACGVWGCKRV